MKLRYLTLKQVGDVVEAAETVLREYPDGDEEPVKPSRARSRSRRLAHNRLFDAVVTLSDNARYELTGLMCLGRDPTQTTLAEIVETILHRPDAVDYSVERARQFVTYLRSGVEKI